MPSHEPALADRRPRVATTERAPSGVPRAAPSVAIPFAGVVGPGGQMPVALAAGGALLLGYSLQFLITEAQSPLASGFHAVGHALIWVSLGLGMIHGLRAAIQAIARRDLSIDILMVVGAALAAAIGHPSEGALLLFMFTLAGALEHRALARAKDAVARLHRIMPQEALKSDADGRWIEVLPELLVPGDRILVRAGETVPADARVITGRSTIDQSALTGESLPRSVDAGDDIFAGTLNQNGAIEAMVSRPVAESSLRRILELVTEAQEQRQPIQRLIDRFSTPYTAAVFAVAGCVFAWFALGGAGPDGERLDLFDAAYRAITLLIVASPCALVIAAPTATLCGLNRAARAGLLVKGGDALERLSTVGSIAMDKTGTLTTGRIEVIATRSFTERAEAASPGRDAEGQTLSDRDRRSLAIALAMEQRSTHPVAVAIVRHAESLGIEPAAIDGFEMLAGKGIGATHDGREAHIGAIEYIEPRLGLMLRGPVLEAIHGAWGRGGITAVMVHDGHAIVFELADRVREGAESLVADLRAAGVRRIAMLTGDSWTVARTVAARIGIDERDVSAELLPEQKVQRLRELKREAAEGPGPSGLAVVGDGVNDAPALALADVGLAMGGVGADAAIESADVVVLNDDLRVIPWAIRLARHVQRVMLANLVFATGVIVALAAGALLGWIPMGLGVIGHEGSTLLVVANSLQILAHRPPGGRAMAG